MDLPNLIQEAMLGLLVHRDRLESFNQQPQSDADAMVENVPPLQAYMARAVLPKNNRRAMPACNGPLVNGQFLQVYKAS
jgi:hypothetical protein